VLALVMAMARSRAEQARGMSLFIAVSSIGASAGLQVARLKIRRWPRQAGTDLLRTVETSMVT